jgi:hypothetical protein
MFATRALVAWLPVLVLAILNGALRELLLVLALGKSDGYLLSGLLLLAFVVLAAIALALTLIFEFGLGILQGHSWTEMLAQYTLMDGNIWPLVPLGVFVAPLVGWRCKGAS